MAVFKTPRITTLQRMALVLEESEIVYDTDMRKPFYGDGVTVGGASYTYGLNQVYFVKTGHFTLSEQQILNKEIELSHTPIVGSVSFNILNGITQLENIDFYLDQNFVRWDNYGLDGFLDETDLIQISYSFI